jgi:nucleoside-diphosphate-sugar epimerase
LNGTATINMNALVTGATGFVGGALARRLVAEGWTVTGLGRNRLSGAALEAIGVHMIYGDLADAAVVQDACAGQSWVFHCGALSAAWGAYDDFYAANVIGTRNVVAACFGKAGVRLVHCSTPSIYFGYKSRLNVAEGGQILPPVNAYVNTKWAAEAIIQMHRHGLQAIILRPRAIFGEGDTSLLPRVVERLAQGRLPIIGNGSNVVDLTYIDNVVEAFRACIRAPLPAWGRAYNISNGEPVPLWEVISQIAQSLGYPLPSRHIPTPVAMKAAQTLEGIWRTLRLRREPPLTRFAVAALAYSSTLDITAARTHLGYTPLVNMEAALERTLASLSAAPLSPNAD